MAIVAAALRLVVLVQIVVSAPSGARLSSRPVAYLALVGAAVAISIVLIIQCALRRAVRPGLWHVPDLALAWVALPAMNLLLPITHVVGTWESWAAGYAVNVVALASTWLRPVAAALISMALGAWYFTWTTAAGTSTWETNLNDALTLPGYAVVIALFVHYLRALAADADQARVDAIAATRALELQRYQLTVHDATSILRLLSDEGTPAEVLPGLRRQADRESKRLRHYLTGQLVVGHDDVDDRSTVGGMIATALEGFDDLPLELAVDLGGAVVLDPEVRAATRSAVATALHNVRLHANATQVVIHADTDGSSWEIVIADDGVGFDRASSALGFGLKTQVREALSAVGVSAAVHSAPGRGTSVVIAGAVCETTRLEVDQTRRAAHG
ncbi:hypothetical protein ACWEOW_18560 [Monashia sp. NPDC004114]